MSQANVELVEALLAGTADMEREALLAALPQLLEEICTPDVEWVEDPRRADGRTHVGREEVAGSWRRWLEDWDRWGFEVDAVLDCGEEVFVSATEHARGSGSGVSVDGRIYALIALSDGKISRYREFSDEHEARRAAGFPGPG